MLKKIGNGAYGHVWKVQDRKTHEVFALKKIFDAFQHSTDAQRTYREIMFLQELDHKSIIKLYSVLKAENDKDVYLVFEYMEADLHQAIGEGILEDIHKRYIFYQVVRALRYLHSGELIHRDLKPANILLNSECLAKLCDFGLCRSLQTPLDSTTHAVMTDRVATRWYRAPEVLLGSYTYDKPVDVWSLGCILAELYNKGKPLFPGSSTLNQLEKILAFTGSPCKEDVAAIHSDLAESMLDSVPAARPRPLQELFPNIPQDALALIGSMLQFNP